MQVYFHALVHDPNNFDAVVRSAKMHAMLPDGVFQADLARIDLAALPLNSIVSAMFEQSPSVCVTDQVSMA